MGEQMKVINQYYEALEYEINKKEALNKISTLHNNLKFKDNNNFSDRFFQAASIIEKNLSVFKAACNHVDIVTTLLDHLYTAGTKLMFDKNLCIDHFNIIYLMFIICEEYKVPLFLSMAIINNSNWTKIDELYKLLISNHTIEMIIFEDSDLYAVISCLKIKPFLLQVKKIFVQESINQKFLWLLEKNCKYFSYMNLSISIFHSRNELLTYCKDSLLYFNMMSIWSEDITSAKTLAMNLQKDVIFINTLLEFSSGILLPFVKQNFNSLNLHSNYELEPEGRDKINLNIISEGSVYNHFYNGTWQESVSGIYTIHNDDTYAFATSKDTNRCLNSAKETFEIWSNLPITSRIEILNKLASTLEYNGKYLLARTVSKCIESSKTLKNLIICQDERLELITNRVPKGIIFICHNDEVILFRNMILSLLVGNCVIITCAKNTCNIAPYCNMFSTSEIPPGVINLMFNKDKAFRINSLALFDQFVHVTVPKSIILPLK